MNVKTFFLLVFLGRSGLHFLGKKMFVLCVNHTVTKYERGGGIDSIPCDFTTYKKKYSRSSTQSSHVLNKIIYSHYQSTRARGAFGAPAREKFIQALGLLNKLNRITARRHLQK